ncbi:hypothetical protein SAMN05444920_103304 [Nonomuraea solani]|uniref:Ig-like domain (Group 3) n=1 Tax=Nonomuraea solani TaxID=1144553 RepID=A0A1H6BDN3_9ACTN|nr:hypothetical protein [Nonomuraea solani]SEG58377.1 hypothetical protein SAMN05444920_103304 [Nonomuraea solani]
MKRSARLLLATATGAVILAGGIALPATGASAAQYAVTMADDFSGSASAEAYIPIANDVDGKVTLTLKDPGKVTSVSGTIEPPGKSGKSVSFDFSTGGTGAEQTITGRWPISKDDPAGDWQLKVTVTRDTGTNTTPFVVQVSDKQGITGASVNPDPVKLVKGQDVKVTVEATVKDASGVSAKLVSDASREYYDLGDLSKESDGYYRGTTYFADDTPAGSWTLEIYARRGGQTLKGEAAFSVEAAAGGSTKKTKTRVTIAAANKVKKGKTFKVYGKVYRGSKAYKGKKVEVYFKAKGTKTYQLVGFAKATSTGRYSRSFKAKKDGYFQVKVPGTSKTRSALSPQEFVDVR